MITSSLFLLPLIQSHFQAHVLVFQLTDKPPVSPFFHVKQGVFPGGDLSDSFLKEIYDRIKSREIQTGLDHVSQVSPLFHSTESSADRFSCHFIQFPDVFMCASSSFPLLDSKDRLCPDAELLFSSNSMSLSLQDQECTSGSGSLIVCGRLFRRLHLNGKERTS